jgi:DNA-binding NarL/FixJ family response regulator
MHMESKNQAVVSICSSHPLVGQILRNVVATSVALDFKIRVLTALEELQPHEKGEILILDGCCDDDWPKPALRWQKSGGKVLVLLSAKAGSPVRQLQALFLGVQGVIVTSGQWQNEVPQAITTVLEGRMWISREVLNQYVVRISSRGKNSVGSPDQMAQLTTREEQIMSLLLRGYSNKEIANALEIAERTVKYHVSNILQKSQVSNRKELFESITKGGPNESSDPHHWECEQPEAGARIVC